MNRILLLLCSFLTGIVTTGFAQQDPILGQSSTYVVLSSSQINNTNTTVIVGDIGISPGTSVNDSGEIQQAQGSAELGNATAAAARQDAQEAYNTLTKRTPTKTIGPKLNSKGPLPGGVYKVSGNAVLDGILTLDAGGNADAVYIFIIDGDLNSVTATGAVLLTGGTQSKNVYWLVKNDVNFEPITVFHGNLIANGDIVLGRGTNVTGRVMSLNGSVSMNNNKLFLPSLIQTDLGVKKEAAKGDYTIGSEVVYTITVKNSGPSNATNVVLEEQVPAGLLFVKVLEASKGTYDQATNRWTISKLSVNESATLKLVFKVLSATDNTNKVVIIDNPENPDPNPGDNEDKDPIVVTCPAPTLVIAGESDFCASPDNTATYTITKIVGATYTWAASGGITLLSGQNTQEVKVKITGDGVLTATMKDGCGKEYSVAKQIKVVTAPATPTISGATTLCANSQSISYTATSAGADAYEWTATGDIEIVSGKNAATVIVNVGTTGGTLKVAAKNGCAPAGISKEINIVTTAKPAAPASITGSTELCAGTQSTYTAAAVPGTTGYTWKVPAGWAITPTNDPRVVSIKAGETSGSITVTANNSCGTSEPAVLAVKVVAKPAAPTIKGEASACVGTTLTYTLADVPGATGYTWKVPAGWKIISGQLTTSITVEVGKTNGDITAVVTNECGNSEAGKLTVKSTSAPVSSVVGNSEVCLNEQNLIYTLASPDKDATYTWALPSGWKIVKGQGTASITVNAATTGGTISVTGQNKCGTGNTGTLKVTITAPPATPGTITDNSNVCGGLAYSIAAVPGATTYTWSVPAGFTITAGQGTTSIQVKADSPTATGQVTVVANNGACGSAPTSAGIDVSLADGQLNFPKAFSPNGDGQNDTWEISNLLKFPANEVVIFNRWGAEVYKQKNYRNNWNGNKLEQGTYFYKVQVQVCDGVTKEFTGYVTIFR